MKYLNPSSRKQMVQFKPYLVSMLDLDGLDLDDLKIAFLLREFCW